jgi:hypothetical protein
MMRSAAVFFALCLIKECMIICATPPRTELPQSHDVIGVRRSNHSTQLGDVSDVIVSLTTLPMRMQILKSTVRSLLQQTVRVPILIAFPHTFVRFPGIEADIPQWLADLESKGVHVVRCDDRGPVTKLLCALSIEESTGMILGRSRARIITVDDDMVSSLCVFDRLA